MQNHLVKINSKKHVIIIFNFSEEFNKNSIFLVLTSKLIIALKLF